MLFLGIATIDSHSDFTDLSHLSELPPQISAAIAQFNTMESNSLEGGFDDILSLVLARSRGEVGNDAVENALVSLIPVPAPFCEAEDPREKTRTRSPVCRQRIIIADEENYDDDDDTENNSCLKRIARPHLPQKMPTRFSGRPKSLKRKYEDSLEHIPFGKMGSYMLITFGDGPQPHPDVISAALLGARSSLQRAILDARALHRRTKDQRYNARAAAMVHTNTRSNVNREKTAGLTELAKPVIDSEFHGFDRQTRHAPCGFDVAPFEMLFPEEMGAYRRWKKMHEEYTQKKSDPAKSPGVVDGDDDCIEDDTLNPDKNDSSSHGRLYERLQNFDTRTDNMGRDWYMEFSDARRGSFLRRTNTTETKEWRENKKLNSKRGRPSKKHLTWSNLHPSNVVFLRWLGFDTNSSLLPPDEETTQALGFLAHDFLGKIVERAVIIRLEKMDLTIAKAHKPQTGESIIPELAGGDQLDLENIEEAISQTNLNSLYSSSRVDLGKSSDVAQLYFGPGFEDRLELELEEIFGQKDKRLTAEELMVRQEEEKFFSTLAVLPTVMGNSSNIIDKH